MKKLKNNSNLIWIDLEMTGLDPKYNKIIEIATLVTDINLNILCEGPNIIIYQKYKYILNMDKWNYNIHKKNGLIKKVKNSKFNEFIAEKLTINFLKKWVDKGYSPMCGNTVAQDRRFLFKYMPNLESYFNYRYIDVSTIKLILNNWIYNFDNFVKFNKHIALIDIKESVNELLFYKNFLKKYINVIK